MVINGSTVYIRFSTDGVNFTTMATATNAVVDTGLELRETTNKYSAGQREMREAKRNWSVQGDGFVVFDSVNLTPDSLATYLENRQLLFVEVFGASDTQDFSWVGRGYLDANNTSASAEESNVYNLSLVGHRYFGYSWGDFTAQRALFNGGSAESISCANQVVEELRNIEITV